MKFFERNQFIFFEKALSDDPTDVKTDVGINVRLVQKDDFPEVIENFPTLSMIEVENRFNAGHLSFGAEIDGTLVHVRWLSFNEAYLGGLNRPLHVDSNSAYLYDAFTIPKYRGLGISPNVFAEVLNYLRANTKIESVCLCISSTNFPSLRAAQKENLRKIGVVKYLRILNFRRYTIEGENKEDPKKLKTCLALKNK